MHLQEEKEKEEEEEVDLVECQGTRERRRLAATARVVCVHVCGRVVCRCFCVKKANKPVRYTRL